MSPIYVTPKIPGSLIQTGCVKTDFSHNEDAHDIGGPDDKQAAGHERKPELEQPGSFAFDLGRRQDPGFEFHLAAEPPGHQDRHAGNGYQRRHYAPFAQKIHQGDADDGAVNSAQDAHFGEVRDPAHSLNQCRLAARHRSEEHRDGQPGNGRRVFTSTESPPGYRPAKQNQQSGSQGSQNEAPSAEGRWPCAQFSGVAGPHRLSNLADPAAVDAHARNALGQIDDRSV